MKSSLIKVITTCRFNKKYISNLDTLLTFLGIGFNPLLPCPTTLQTIKLKFFEYNIVFNVCSFNWDDKEILLWLNVYDNSFVTHSLDYFLREASIVVDPFLPNASSFSGQMLFVPEYTKVKPPFHITSDNDLEPRPTQDHIVYKKDWLHYDGKTFHFWNRIG